MRHHAFAARLPGLAAACALAAGTAEAADCAALATLKLPHTTLTAAENVAAGAFRQPGAGAMPTGNYAALPAFCRVAGSIKPTADSDIRFEVWMPLANWNGKYVGGGNGVWAGSIAYGDMTGPLAAGYATAASDVGHQGSPMDGSFAANREKLIDFGHRAVHETTVAAKAIVTAFYGKPASRALYASCSTGGRIGLMESYRYPQDFDGISAMAPANPMVNLMIGSVWTGYVAMKDADSRIPPPKFALAHKAVVEACDAGDGLKDGIISAPQRCKFDPAVLQCKAGDAADCLTAGQVTALEGIYDGARNPRTGKLIYPGFTPGSESQVGILTMGQEPFPVATSFMRAIVFRDPTWDFRSFDYDKDVQRSYEAASFALDVPAEGLPRARRQAAAVAWLGRRPDFRHRHGGLLRAASAQRGQGCRKERAAVHDPGHGPLRRRRRSFDGGHAGHARPLGRDRQGAGTHHRRECAERHTAHAPAVPMAAGSEVHRQRQHRRRGELPLRGALNRDALA
jgi:hypothetical protein